MRHDPTIDEFDDLEDDHPSKSAKKRDCAALTDLGEELIDLPEDRLRRLDLPEELRAAIELARTIESHHSAFKRQRKYVGKLIREMDEGELIRAQLAQQTAQRAAEIHLQHRIETWRDRLLAGDDRDINALMAEFPQLDRQKLRQLVRSAHRESEKGLPPKSARELFRFLRAVFETAEAEDS